MEDVILLIKTGQIDALKEKLESEPSLANAKTEQGLSLLQYAAYFRNKEAIDVIKSKKENIDIFEAATIGDIETLQKKLSAEEIDSYSTDGFTLLGLASYFAQVETVQFLLDKGADPNKAANNGMKVTPLNSACASSNYAIAELLLKKGADVNAKQMRGITPLHSAAHNGNIKLAYLLLKHGADINAKSDQNESVVSMAEEKQHKEMVSFLKEQENK